MNKNIFKQPRQFWVALAANIVPLIALVLYVGNLLLSDMKAGISDDAEAVGNFIAVVFLTPLIMLALFILGYLLDMCRKNDTPKSYFVLSLVLGLLGTATVAYALIYGIEI
jgi:uncharacterized membrane protein YhaH (DUF805 family)